VDNNTGYWGVDDAEQWHDLNKVHPGFSTMSAGQRREFDDITMFRLGMVIVVVTQARIVIRWSVSDIDEISLEAVMAFLDSMDVSPNIMIEYFYGGWERQFVSNPKAAVEM
jgi:hypothetical protein